MAEPLDPEGGSAPEHLRSALGEVRRMAEEAVQEVMRRNPHATLAEINAALEARNSAYNRRPQQELGGLSPVQMQHLLADDWNGDGVVRLNTDLPIGELSGSRILHNARLLLALLTEKSSVRATTAGNLPRAVVAELVAGMRWPAGYREEMLRGTLNEQDVFPLHTVRVLLELARLAKRRKGMFSPTRRGADLLADARAGELYALLFRTHFRTFNLAYLSGIGPEAPGFQHAIAYALYRFGQVADRWSSAAAIADAVLLGPVRAELPVAEYADWGIAVTESRLLRPLEGFALAEVREVPREGSPVPTGEYRRLPLFRRFLGFVLDAVVR